MRPIFASAIAFAAMVMTLSAGTAQAQVYRTEPVHPFARASYNGTWPVTITHSQFYNGTGCLTLAGSSTGTASLVINNRKYSTGSFLVLDSILLATVPQPEDSQNGAFTFAVHAEQGSITGGVFELISGGSDADSGNVKFGAKNGC
jgi:hypothetical protein